MITSVLRRKLPHQVPPWVDSSKEVYFLTVCCQPRGTNQLAVPNVAHDLFDTVQFRQRQRLWFVHVIILMPDHLHALLSFGTSHNTMEAIILSWKEWTAKQLKINWQRDFFEHRLRSYESRKQKADYILANPVRAGLVSRAEFWPYVWFPDDDHLRR
jgi:putative transposase